MDNYHIHDHIEKLLNLFRASLNSNIDHKELGLSLISVVVTSAHGQIGPRLHAVLLRLHELFDLDHNNTSISHQIVETYTVIIQKVNESQLEPIKERTMDFIGNLLRSGICQLRPDSFKLSGALSSVIGENIRPILHTIIGEITKSLSTTSTDRK